MAVIPAYVRIDGQVFPASWDGTSAIALGDLAIVWGTDSRYDEIPPAELSLTLIDPAGWVFTTQLQGMPIDVAWHASFGTNSMMFRGRIQEAIPEPATIISPVTNRPVSVWRVRITAKDPLADLATASIAGPASDGSWPAQSWADRVDHILDHVRSPQLEEIQTPSSTGTVRAYEADDKVNLLDMLRRGWWSGTVWVRRPQYTPRRWTGVGGIEQAVVWHNRGLILNWNGSQLVLETYGGNDHIVNASRITMPSGRALESTLDAAIDVVQAVSQNADGDALVAEQTTARHDPTRGVRVLRIDTDIVSSFPIDGVANLLAEYADTLNGSWQHPRIRVSSEAPGGATDPELPQAFNFMRAWMVDEAYFFIGSQYSGIPGAGGLLQVIGGTLRCDGERWTHDMTLAPTIDTVDTPPVVPINALVTNPTPTLSSFDPRITIADLGYVTEGAA